MLIGYITVSEIAKRWKVNPRTIQVMCLKGKIQGAEICGAKFVNIVSLRNGSLSLEPALVFVSVCSSQRAETACVTGISL